MWFKKDNSIQDPTLPATVPPSVHLVSTWVSCGYPIPTSTTASPAREEQGGKDTLEATQSTFVSQGPDSYMAMPGCRRGWKRPFLFWMARSENQGFHYQGRKGEWRSGFNLLQLSSLWHWYGHVGATDGCSELAAELMYIWWAWWCLNMLVIYIYKLSNLLEVSAPLWMQQRVCGFLCSPRLGVHL